MRYLLDTNSVIALLGKRPSISRRVHSHSSQDFGLSVIVSHELYFGAFRSRRSATNLRAIEDLRFEPVEFDTEDARLAASIRAELAARGTPIGAYDVLIAAQARSRDLTLITRNVAEFSRVADLRWENWES